MFNIVALIKFINTNNDEIITKKELNKFTKTQNNSIFTDFINNIDTNLNINEFKDRVENWREQERHKGNWFNLNFKDKNSEKEYQKSEKINEAESIAYSFCGYKFKTDKEFYKIFNKLVKKYDNKPDMIDNILHELTLKTQNTNPVNILERLNTGKFTYINNDFQHVVFDNVDLTKYSTAFKHITFNEKTFSKVSPENLPKDFNPKEILEKGKTIGLGINKAHEMGYKGKDVSYAIIDSGVTPHDDLKFKEYNIAESAKNDPYINHFHGSAVSYIAQEIAPEANCYYYAQKNSGEYSKSTLENLKSILEKNTTLPKNQRIRFVSMSMPLYGGEEAKQVVAELEAQGVWVYYSGCPEDQNRGYLEKINPNGDPDDFNNYQISMGGANYLYVNSGDRTVPDPSSPNAYRHDSEASQSWSIPVIAGYYTLACQADPSMTKEKFLKFADASAKIITSSKPQYEFPFDSENGVYESGRTAENVEIKIIDITALLKMIEKNKTVN